MAGMSDEDLKTLCKTSLRLTSTAYDEMIASLIEAAKEDISLSCDTAFDNENKNECLAVVLYVKGQFPYQPDDKSWDLYQKRLSVIGTRKAVTPAPAFSTEYELGSLAYTNDSTFDFDVNQETGELEWGYREG